MCLRLLIFLLCEESFARFYILWLFLSVSRISLWGCWALCLRYEWEIFVPSVSFLYKLWFLSSWDSVKVSVLPV